MKRVREEEEEKGVKRVHEEEEEKVMKRMREEKEIEDEEQEEEQEQPAPMMSSPSPNPGPAAAATASGTAERRVITKYDVVDFMMRVKRTFEGAKYYEFLDIILQIDSIGVQGIADHMKVLLRGYPDLKHHFNMFLPTQYELTLSEDDDDDIISICASGKTERRVITKYDVVDFMMSVKRTFERAKYYEFLNIILQIDSIGVQGIVDQMKVLLRGYPDLKRHFDMFLPMQY